MRYSLLLASVLFAAAIALGMQAPPGAYREVLEDLRTVFPTENISLLGLLAIILINNLVKSLLVILLGVGLGIPPLLFIVMNGLVLGVVVSGFGAEEGYAFTAAGLAPHGIIEIPLLIWTSAIGLMIGLESLRALTGRQSQVKARLWGGLKTYITWILPGLVVAAFIETFITPIVINLARGG